MVFPEIQKQLFNAIQAGNLDTLKALFAKHSIGINDLDVRDEQGLTILQSAFCIGKNKEVCLWLLELIPDATPYSQDSETYDARASLYSASDLRKQKLADSGELAELSLLAARETLLDKWEKANVGKTAYFGNALDLLDIAVCGLKSHKITAKLMQLNFHTYTLGLDAIAAFDKIQNPYGNIDDQVRNLGKLIKNLKPILISTSRLRRRIADPMAVDTDDLPPTEEDQIRYNNKQAVIEELIAALNTDLGTNFIFEDFETKHLEIALAIQTKYHEETGDFVGSLLSKITANMTHKDEVGISKRYNGHTQYDKKVYIRDLIDSFSSLCPEYLEGYIADTIKTWNYREQVIAIIYALNIGKPEIAKKLLSWCEIDIDADLPTDIFGEESTILDKVYNYDHEYDISGEKVKFVFRPERLKAFIDAGGDVNNVLIHDRGPHSGDGRNFLPIQVAAQHGDLESLNILIAAGVNYNTPYRRYGTALSMACQQSGYVHNLNVALRLLELPDIDVLSTNGYNCAPLYYIRDQWNCTGITFGGDRLVALMAIKTTVLEKLQARIASQTAEQAAVAI